MWGARVLGGLVVVAASALLAGQVALVGRVEAQLIPPKATVTTPEGKTIEEAQQEAYDGPKARIAVARFTDKTGKGWWTGAIGDGMADMLATALFHTNRFIVLERQTLADVLKEQDLAAGGRIKKGTEAPIGEIEGAELLVTGAVTEFEPGQSGVGGGVGGIGGLGGTKGRILGGILGGIRTAHMAIDVRVIDTRTSRIVAATSVEGKATDFALGGALAGAGGGGALAGALAGWSKTPIEKALRICIQEAVGFIVSKTPTTYYRHRPAAVTAAATSPAPPPAPAPTPGPTALAPPAAAPGAAGTPPAAQILQTIRADLDRNVLIDLNEVRVRGAVVTVVVTLRNAGPTPSKHLFVATEKSGILNYDTGERTPAVSLDGFNNATLGPGDAASLRATFRVPQGARKVAITLSGLGTFDDVELAR